MVMQLPLNESDKQTNENCSPLVVSLQVFQTSSEKIESAGLAALTALTSCLSRSVLNSDSEDSLCTFLDLVLKGETLWNHFLCVRAVVMRGFIAVKPQWLFSACELNMSCQQRMRQRHSFPSDDA